MRKSLTAILVFLVPLRAFAQHEHHAPVTDSAQPDHQMMDMMSGPLGISHNRMGSGTTWMPDASVMHANHKMWGDWTIMLHGVAFGQYDYQGSDRGDDQFGIVDWEMVMAMKSIGTGRLHLHAMASLEPLTLGARGYPLLLQTGESFKGEPLHDRQHPHDAFMELATMFQQPISRNLAIELYGGLAGEPALGPVAFMHRPSAQSDPLAPLGHHWQDATHITYGVLTAGLYSRAWKVEGSVFNGREPNENRWNLDLRRLDSYSGRVTFNPLREWSFSGWYGYLASPEGLHPEESVHRYGVSSLHSGRGLRGGQWNSTLLVSANDHSGHKQGSALGETNFEIGSRNSLFARAEIVRKSAEDLVLPGIDPERQFDIKSFVVGYMREIQPIRGGTIGIGGRASVNFIPDAVGQFYVTRAPKGIDLYVRIRPKKMEEMHDMSHMKPMDMKGMQHEMPAAGPAPAPMPGMEMPGMKMPSPAPHDTMTMHHDSTMTHHVQPAKSAKSSAPVVKHPVKKKRSTKKAAPKKKPTAKTHPAHDMKGMDMKGMKMKPDTTRKKQR